MFRIVQRTLQYHIRLTEQTTIDTNVCVVVLLQCQNSYLKSISNISESKSPPSRTVDYLINSFGFPLETALSVSKQIHLSSTEKPDSVLTFFQNHGFTKTQITKIISKRPSLLLSDPTKTFKPKVEFLLDLGFSGPNLPKLLIFDPTLLTRSLQNQIIPSLNFLKSFLSTNDDILTAFKRSIWGFYNFDTVIGPNIAILRDQGLPECSISKLLMIHPRTLMHKTDRYKEVVEVVKKLGFDSSSLMFIHAVRVVAGMSKSSWEDKFEVYRSLGFSEDEILSAFKRQPLCMITSNKKIRRVVEFFIEKLKWKPVDISLHPNVLTHSLEKRIIPRCTVLEILNSKGMIRRKLMVTTLMNFTEKEFLDEFVTKYHETIPEVMKAYNGGYEFTGFGERRVGWG